MRYARGLLQEAAVVATSTALTPANHAANQLATTGGSATGPNSPSTDSSSSDPFYVNSHFSPTMIIILVILLSAFLFMAFFAVYVRRCTSEDGFSRRGSSRRMQGRRGDDTGSTGVDPSLVESYPIVSYAAAKKKGCYECPVCLGEFEGEDELKQLPKCKHVFHPGCISLWLESHTTCPLCRRSLVNSDRWSMSFRWGGSSRESSLSTRRNGSLSRRSGERASSRFGGARADSTAGWFGRNEDTSVRGACAEQDTNLGVIDASCRSSEYELQGLPSNSLSSSQHGSPASDRLLEVASRGLPTSPDLASELAPREPAESILSNLLPQDGMEASSHEIQKCTDLTPRGYQSPKEATRGRHASNTSSELAGNVLSEVAKSEGRNPGQAAARRKLRRSNSTGHSLRKRAVLQAANCVRPFSLHRSRSVGEDDLDEEEAMVGGARATSEHGPVSGSRCNSQIPRTACHDSTSASASAEK